MSNMLLTLVIMFWYLPFSGAFSIENDKSKTRLVYSLDDNWNFFYGDTMPDLRNNLSWKTISLPHDCSVEQGYSRTNTPQNGYLPGGVAWYRREINIDKKWLGKNIILSFDGIYMNSTVWLNGVKVGGHPYGFISFTCDITNKIREGSNTLEIKVDNTPVPTIRFYHGTGIYSHAKLIIISPVHINTNGGVFIQTEKIENKVASLSIKTEVINASPKKKKIAIRQKIFDKDNNFIADLPVGKSVITGKDTLFSAQSVLIENPDLWSDKKPYLYRLETSVEENGNVIDIVTTPFGIRTSRFDAATGFWLNDKNIKLKGVCEHLEMMPVGLAVTDEMWEWRLQKLKSMGCNAIRTAHNPFPPMFYDLCDQYGIMVMNEIFDGWHKKKANDYGERFFEKWWKHDVEYWVRRDRNHPSVILWSIGNETGENDINNISGHIHKFDPRPTTGGTILSGVDVAGFNAPGERPGELEFFHEEIPGKPVVLTEVPHTFQTRGFYRTLNWFRDIGDPRIHEFVPYNDTQIFFDGRLQYRSSYDNCQVRMNVRQSWKRTKNTPWISGEFRWTGFDSFGESQFMGAEFPKRSYSSGVIDLAGFPKDHFYLYQSFWTDKPMVHILPHWTHPDLDRGTKIPVVAYSNCEEVELFLNNVSLGKQKPGDLLDFVWHVPYQEGELQAIAYINGKNVSEKKIRTADYPVYLQLTRRNSEFIPGKKDFSYVEVATTDKSGNFVPWTQNRINFMVEGPARILGFENGNPIDSTNNLSLYRNLFYGLMRGYFESTNKDGEVVVTAGGVLGDTLFQGQTQVAIDVRRIFLRGEGSKDDLAIHFTIDGSKPDKNSALYSDPFQITENTFVQALILENGKQILELSQKFSKGEEIKIIDERWKNTEKTENYPIDFPVARNKVLIGKWKEGNLMFEFDKDGTLFKHFAEQKVPVAFWWYTFPDDLLESPEYAGEGQIRWMDSGMKSAIKLISQEARKLQITSGKSVRTFSR